MFLMFSSRFSEVQESTEDWRAAGAADRAVLFCPLQSATHWMSRRTDGFQYPGKD